MDPLRHIQAEVHRKVTDSRALDRIVSSEPFLKAWASADEASRLTVAGYCQALDRVKVERWIREHADLEDKLVTELRRVAARLGIANYSHKTKAELLVEINAQTSDPSGPHRDEGTPAVVRTQA